jgi:N6-L-threonylcarbamoyladenine synthase
MIILGIETSCDETAAAVLGKKGNQITILSNIIASSAKLQAKYGGIIPEQAAREQIKSIIPVIETAINDSQLTIHDLDAIAVTQGPGLIGSLLVGVETAKTLSLVWNKPLIPVNHLIGHFYANWIENTGNVSRSRYYGNKKPLIHNTNPTFPCVGLLVSGGHTDLVLFTGHGKYQYLGGTRDDASGECFDKCARLLGLSYPGGPEIARLARKGDPKAFNLPRPMIDSGDLDFSFSGLKTAVSNLVMSETFSRAVSRMSEASDKAEHEDVELICDLAASIEQAIIDPLIKKTLKAAKLFKVNQIIVAGGVAANDKLISEFNKTISNERLTMNLFVPQSHLCTDNAAMIASAAYYQKPISDPLKLEADPNLALAY